MVGEHQPDDYYDMNYGDGCAYCDDGFVAHCEQEFACVAPEAGCDLCIRPCEICGRGD